MSCNGFDLQQDELQPGDRVHLTAEGHDVSLHIARGGNSAKAGSGLTSWLFGGSTEKKPSTKDGDAPTATPA